MIVAEFECLACQERLYATMTSLPEELEDRCGRCGEAVTIREVGELVPRVPVIPLLAPAHTVVIAECSANGGQAGVVTGAGATTFVLNSDFRGMPVAVDNTSGATIHVHGNRHLPHDR